MPLAIVQFFARKFAFTEVYNPVSVRGPRLKTGANLIRAPSGADRLFSRLDLSGSGMLGNALTTARRRFDKSV